MQKLYLSFQKFLVSCNTHKSLIFSTLLVLSLLTSVSTFLFSAVNSGFDPQDTIVKLLEESTALGEAVGLDLSTGEAIKPADAGIYDNYNVKKQIINSW